MWFVCPPFNFVYTLDPMIAAPSLASSQFLGSRIASPRRRASRRLSSVRSPSPRPPRVSAVLSAPAPAAFTAAPPSLYDLLGVPAGATGPEIKAAYRRLARACHPDAAAGGREGASADEFMRIHAAYSTLSDSEKRANYDRELFMIRRQRRSPFSSYSSPSFSGYSRRTWETDQCW